MKKITFLQLTAAVIMLAFGLTLVGPFTQSADAHLDWLCDLANIAVSFAWDAVDHHCFQNPNFDNCNNAWATYGIVVAIRDAVCHNHDDDDDDDDDDDNEESSS